MKACSFLCNLLSTSSILVSPVFMTGAGTVTCFVFLRVSIWSVTTSNWTSLSRNCSSSEDLVLVSSAPSSLHFCRVLSRNSSAREALSSHDPICFSSVVMRSVKTPCVKARALPGFGGIGVSKGGASVMTVASWGAKSDGSSDADANNSNCFRLAA